MRSVLKTLGIQKVSEVHKAEPAGGRGIHSRPNDGLTNDWLTPPSIVKALGKFDLDPCAHPQQFYRTAKTMIAPPFDGLADPWKGRVWLNPPYGSLLRRWLKTLADHGNGIALVPARTEVVRGRLYFHKPDGSTAGNAGHGSVLAAYGDKNVSALEASGIEGKFIALEAAAKEGA